MLGKNYRTMDKEMMNPIKSEDEDSDKLIHLDEQDPLSDPLGDSLLNPAAHEENIESCDLGMGSVWPELASSLQVMPQLCKDLKTESLEFEVVKKEPQEIEVIKTEPQEIDDNEIILPDWNVADTVTNNEPVMKTEHGLLVSAKLPELKNESLCVENPPTSQIVMSMVLESEKEQYECSLNKEEKRNIIPCDLNPGEISSERSKLLCSRQCFQDSNVHSCGEKFQFHMSSYNSEGRNIHHTEEVAAEDKPYQDEESFGSLSKYDNTKKELCTCGNSLKMFISGKNCFKRQHLNCSRQTPQLCEGRKFHDVNNKNIYTSCHRSQTLFVCEDCGLQFLTECHLKDHVQTVHLEVKQYEYQHYGKRFCKNENMKKHILLQHLKEKKNEFDYSNNDTFQVTKGSSISLKKQQFSCQQCEQLFVQSSNLRKHVQTVHLKKKLFECPHCQQKFGQNSNMNKHVQTVHLKKKEFECPHCEQRFGDSSNMKKHVQSIHMKKKQFECPHCEQKFSQNSNMKAHIQTVHLKKKNFQCPHCEQRFSHSCHVNKHVQTVHLKKKRFECPHCEQKFGFRNTLKVHIETVHMKKKQFECMHCEKKFGQRSNLKKHIQSVHLKQKNV